MSDTERPTIGIAARALLDRMQTTEAATAAEAERRHTRQCEGRTALLPLIDAFDSLQEKTKRYYKKNKKDQGRFTFEWDYDLDDRIYVRTGKSIEGIRLVYSPEPGDNSDWRLEFQHGAISEEWKMSLTWNQADFIFPKGSAIDVQRLDIIMANILELMHKFGGLSKDKLARLAADAPVSMRPDTSPGVTQTAKNVP